jgi:hypothetical protein
MLRSTPSKLVAVAYLVHAIILFMAVFFFDLLTKGHEAIGFVGLFVLAWLMLIFTHSLLSKMKCPECGKPIYVGYFYREGKSWPRWPDSLVNIKCQFCQHEFE